MVRALLSALLGATLLLAAPALAEAGSGKSKGPPGASAPDRGKKAGKNHKPAPVNKLNPNCGNGRGKGGADGAGLGKGRGNTCARNAPPVSPG